MRGRVILTILFATACVGAGAPQRTKPDLRKVVGLTGEIGIAAIHGDTISMFSKKDIFIKDASSDWKIREMQYSGVVSLRVKGSAWKRADKNLNMSTAYRPALCDPLNQIDVTLQHRELSLVLPKGARMKVAQKFDDLALVVYSTSADAVTYDIRVALLQLAKSGNYMLIKADTATEDGTVCGMQDADDDHYVVLADEPSASSDFLTLYVYAVVR